MSTGGTYAHVRIGKAPGTSAAHMRYILRDRAITDGRDGVALVNFPAELDAPTLQELRLNAAIMANVNEDIERARFRGAGECRTHLRLTLSYEERIHTAAAVEDAKAFLATTPVLRGTRALVACHQDTDQTHLHIWIEARRPNGKKLDIGPRAYRTIDEHWNRVYCERTGRDPWEHLDKKAKTLQYKRTLRSYHEAVERGESPARPEAPIRTHYTKAKARSMYERREKRLMGVEQQPARVGQITIPNRIVQGDTQSLSPISGVFCTLLAQLDRSPSNKALLAQVTGALANLPEDEHSALLTKLTPAGKALVDTVRENVITGPPRPVRTPYNTPARLERGRDRYNSWSSR